MFERPQESLAVNEKTPSFNQIHPVYLLREDVQKREDCSAYGPGAKAGYDHGSEASLGAQDGDYGGTGGRQCAENRLDYHGLTMGKAIVRCEDMVGRDTCENERPKMLLDKIPVITPPMVRLADLASMLVWV